MRMTASKVTSFESVARDRIIEINADSVKIIMISTTDKAPVSVPGGHASCNCSTHRKGQSHSCMGSS